ncbi:MAG: Uma2 family endonuclease [Crocosphaera sp.]|nr:Uma2 family endonuclease [Crocosphaera sp.]
MKVTLDIASSDLEKLLNPMMKENRIALNDISWDEYESLLSIFKDKPLLRLSYLEGNLEIMTNSPEHEMIKTLIRRLIEIYALEKAISLYGCGSATYKKEAQVRGLEPDESYCFGSRKEIPDLAIEVIITSGGINKLKIYQGLNVPEVLFWQEGKLTLYRLINELDGYQKVEQSQFLPELNFEILQQYINPEEEPKMVYEYRQLIKE